MSCSILSSDRLTPDVNAFIAGYQQKTVTEVTHAVYWSMCKPRLAIKMWNGRPTFPQVFVDGKLICGYGKAVAALKVRTIAYRD